MPDSLQNVLDPMLYDLEFENSQHHSRGHHEEELVFMTKMGLVFLTELGLHWELGGHP